MRAFPHGLFALGLLLTLAGCAQQTQQQAVDTALDAESTASETTTEQTSTTLPKNMPVDIQLPNGVVELATEVQDGYQVSYASSQSPDDVLTFYRSREGWSVVAEFPTGEARSISIERNDQRVLATITPKGNGSDVLVTGSYVKEVD